jgi:hypothetical protein
VKKTILAMFKKLDWIDWLQILLAGTLFVMLMVAAAPVFAQKCGGHYGDDCGTDVTTDVTTNVTSSLTGGTTSVGGSDNLALGLGSPSFGAAIGDCMGTQARSFLFGLYGQQTLTESYWCEAFNLASAGYPEAAAYILCNHTVLKDMPGCPGPILSMVPVAPVVVPTVPDDLAEHYQVSDIRYLQLAEQLSRIEAQNQANARAAANRMAEERKYAQSVIAKVKEITP